PDSFAKDGAYGRDHRDLPLPETAGNQENGEEIEKAQRDFMRDRDFPIDKRDSRDYRRGDEQDPGTPVTQDRFGDPHSCSMLNDAAGRPQTGRPACGTMGNDASRILTAALACGNGLRPAGASG